MQHTVTHWNTLQHTATHGNRRQHTATHCNTLQHTATHCNTLYHTATHCNTLHSTASHCNTLQYTAPHCNTPQHTATHCNTLQYTAPHSTPKCRRSWKKFTIKRHGTTISLLILFHTISYYSILLNNMQAKLKESHEQVTRDNKRWFTLYKEASSSVGGVRVCCSVLQCVAVCCSVLPCIAVCCKCSGTCFEKKHRVA